MDGGRLLSTPVPLVFMAGALWMAGGFRAFDRVGRAGAGGSVGCEGGRGHQEGESEGGQPGREHAGVSIFY